MHVNLGIWVARRRFTGLHCNSSLLRAVPKLTPTSCTMFKNDICVSSRWDRHLRQISVWLLWSEYSQCSTSTTYWVNLLNWPSSLRQICYKLIQFREALQTVAAYFLPVWNNYSKEHAIFLNSTLKRFIYSEFYWHLILYFLNLCNSLFIMIGTALFVWSRWPSQGMHLVN